MTALPPAFMCFFLDATWMRPRKFTIRILLFLSIQKQYLYPRGNRPPYLIAQRYPTKKLVNVNNATLTELSVSLRLKLCANYILKFRYSFKYVCVNVSTLTIQKLGD